MIPVMSRMWMPLMSYGRSDLKVIRPPKGNLVISGHAPTVTTFQQIIVGAGTLSITGYAPTSLVNVATITPEAGALSITCYAPTIDVAYGSDWGYYGAIMSACATTKDDPFVSRFNKDGSGTDEQTQYYGSTDLANLVYGFSNGSGSTDYDFTSSTYDRTVPFSRNGSEFIESEAYENDYSADVASHVWQLLDASDNNIFKFECVGRTSGYGVDCYYTSGGGSRTAVAATGSYPALWHVFTFTDTQVTGTDNYGGSNHIDTFSVAADIASATQLKVSGGRAYMSTSGLYLHTYSRVSYFPEGYPV